MEEEGRDDSMSRFIKNPVFVYTHEYEKVK